MKVETIPNLIETEKERYKAINKPKSPDKSKLSIDFSDIDNVIDSTGNKKVIFDAPKDLDTLEKIAIVNNEKRALEDKR